MKLSIMFSPYKIKWRYHFNWTCFLLSVSVNFDLIINRCGEVYHLFFFSSSSQWSLLLWIHCSMILDQTLVILWSNQRYTWKFTLHIWTVNTQFLIKAHDNYTIVQPSSFSTGPQCSPTQLTDFADTSSNNVTTTTTITTFPTASNNYPFLDSLLLQQGPRPNAFVQVYIFFKPIGDKWWNPRCYNLQLGANA